MATINDIAKRLGIAKSTVSKALNNATDVSPQTREKVLEMALALDYSNKHMRERQKKLCIIIENMEYATPNHFGYDLVHSFQQAASKDGWLVDCIPISKEFQRGTSYGVFMIQNEYAGAFILGLSLVDPWINSFSTSKVPAVLYDNYIVSNPHVASVECDNFHGIDEAIHYLKNFGHTKIGLISGPLESYIQKARYNAYIETMAKYHLTIEEGFIGIDYYVEDATKVHVKRMYDMGITAILCTHDLRAVSALQACINLGIRIPQDMSIIGFDDIPIATLTTPSLTTIRQDRIALGKSGYYALSCLLEGMPMQNIRLFAPLVIRESTGPVPIPI